MGGKIDEGLCEEGISELKKIHAGQSVKQIFSSPMKRCLETASILFPGKQPLVIEEFRELDFGCFEGKTHQELIKLPSYQRWIDSNGRGEIPDGESFEDFRERALRGFEKMYSMMENPEAVAVVHGGIIMSVLSKINGGDFYDYYTENGHGYEIKFLYDGNKKPSYKVIELRKI